MIKQTHAGKGEALLSISSSTATGFLAGSSASVVAVVATIVAAAFFVLGTLAFEVMGLAAAALATVRLTTMSLSAGI